MAAPQGRRFDAHGNPVRAPGRGRRRRRWGPAGTAVAVVALVSGLLAGAAPPAAAAAATTDFPAWARTARVAGASVWTGMTATQINTVLTNMANQNVSVIEADSNLSNYMTEAEFQQELALMRQFSTAAHAKGLQVGWYYPTLEVLTENGATAADSMYKTHPDWVQVGLDGTPNVFYGNQVFWVEPGMESAWMSPSSPGYRTFYYDRVKRIAATGLDYFWADVPLLYDVGTQWADINPAANARFLAATGLTAPASMADMNWNDPRWRRWIAWRHEEVADFLKGVSTAGLSVDPNFKLIVETVTMDYASGTKIGLDGSYLKDVPGVTHVWELDPVSNAYAMRRAKEDDWIRMIAMNKYANAASGDKPAWVFDYGKQADDAELVMAETLAAGNNPYESKIPIMATTVGAAYRTKMFNWAKANEAQLFGPRNAARVAVLYSPENRDFVDRAAGESMYATTTSSDAEFWSTDAVDSVYKRQYLAEYNGMVKLLVHNHIPFDVVVSPSAAELAQYQTLILPDIEAVSDEDAALLTAYTTGGGHLVATGPNPTGWDQYGGARGEFALAGVLGVSKATALPAAKVTAVGAGETRFFRDLLGKAYETNAAGAPAAATALLGAVNATTTPWLSTDADKKVHLELWQGTDELLLHQVNFIGVDGSFSVTPTTSTTTVHVPDGKAVTAVELTSPDNATPGRSPLAHTVNGQDVTFTVPVSEYALVVISLRDSGPVANRPPAAAADTLATTSGAPVGFTAGQLVANDTDPDGDPLTVTGVDATSAAGGTITGAYTYTPPAGFTGVDTFRYTVADGRGGRATGTVSVTVSATPVNRPPVAAADAYTTSAGTPLTVAAPGVLANDTDPDGDGLTVTASTAPAHGTVTVATGGGFTYTPATGYTGGDTFGYTVADGRGGTATGTVTVTVAAAGTTPQTVYPGSLTVLTGRLDSGGPAGLKAKDAQTYDVRSAFVAAQGGGIADWYGSMTITGSPAAVSALTVAYAGQYSKASVTQRVYLYNFTTSTWDLFDTRTVGNQDDVTVAVTPGNARAYVSSTGEVRARVSGFRAGAQSTTAWSFLCWANLLKVDVR